MHGEEKETISELKKKIHNCCKCDKAEPWTFPRYNNVSGFLGDSDIMFVAERPSTGRFSKADKLFYRLLRKHGFEKAHLTDITKCRKKVREEVSLEEISNCLVYFKEELAIIRPKVIVALGNKTYTMLKALLPALGTLDVQLEKIMHYSYVSRFKKEDEYDDQFKNLKDKLKQTYTKSG